MPGIIPKILVVDGDAPNRTTCAETLRRIPRVEVVEAASGQQALDLARHDDFALYLLATLLPDMDGFELASLLRQESLAEPTPVVFVSAEASERPDPVRVYRMGGVDYLAASAARGEILVQKARVFAQLFRRRQELKDAMEAMRRENQELQSQIEDFARRQELLRAQATHDTLTKLPNRALFHDHLEAAIARARRGRQRFAVAYLDLDGFKAVNDRHGHATGDALLVSAANRLLKAVRATDTVARLGGDEFAMLFEGLDSAGGALYVASKIHASLVQPMTLPSEADRTGVAVKVGVSIGLAVYPDHSTEAEGLLTLADMAMYEAKRAGGGLQLHREDRIERPEVPAALHLVRRHGERKGSDR